MQYLTIYLQKELQRSDGEKCKEGAEMAISSKKWRKLRKAPHLSSCGISSPLGFTHRRSRTSSKFGTLRIEKIFFQLFLKENQKNHNFFLTWKNWLKLVFSLLCGNIFLFLPTLTIYVMPLFIALGSFTEKVQFAWSFTAQFVILFSNSCLLVLNFVKTSFRYRRMFVILLSDSNL